MDAENEVIALKKFFAKKMEGLTISVPEVKPILVFTSDEVELNAGDSPIPALKLKQLKEFLRQGAKNRALTSDQIAKITSLFEQE